MLRRQMEHNGIHALLHSEIFHIRVLAHFRSTLYRSRTQPYFGTPGKPPFFGAAKSHRSRRPLA
jgi:hypothetical protein